MTTKPARRSPGKVAVLAPCFLAPLAVMFPWTVAPSHLPGVAVGGFRFFLTWLTKYPDLGGVNIKVLLGMICVLGAGVVPLLFGALAWRRAPSAWLLGVFGLDLLFYVPVLVRLDLLLLVAGLAQVIDRGGDGARSFGAVMVVGPLLRAAAAAAMAGALLCRRRTPRI